MGNSQKIYIKHFQISGLHGDQDIALSFDTPYKILVAENGSGKTTVLNSLFYLLTGQYHKLSRIDFEKMTLTPDKGPPIEILKEDVYQVPENLDKIPQFSALKSRIGGDLAKILIEVAVNLDLNRDIRETPEFRQIRAQYPGPTIELQRILDRIRRDYHSPDLFSYALTEKKKKVKETFPLDVFYLPTYRRVEEDLQSLGYEGEFSGSKEQLIHFGMRDVSGRFAKITKDIRDSAVTWYSRVSGRMLDELMDGISVDKDKLEQIKQPEALEIVLDRIGQNISQKRKKEILELVQSENIYKDQYNALAYFLSNLIDIYDQQREKDNRIKEFVKVASKYLVNKEIRYDESNVKITVINVRTEKEVELENLSSGEKQLISILSKLYLESDKPSIIIFDEPELSLSIEWQKDLLPDIIASGQCEFLLAATHSPFIFENELDKYAEALSVSYREVVND